MVSYVVYNFRSPSWMLQNEKFTDRPSTWGFLVVPMTKSRKRKTVYNASNIGWRFGFALSQRN